jgi:hypothetical protein
MNHFIQKDKEYNTQMGTLYIIDNNEVTHTHIVWYEGLNEYSIYIESSYSSIIDYLISNNICIFDNYPHVTYLTKLIAKLNLTQNALLQLL